jgi:hypothetical protein
MIKNLNEDILTKIITYLEPSDFNNLKLVSNDFYIATSKSITKKANEIFWRDKVEENEEINPEEVNDIEEFKYYSKESFKKLIRFENHNKPLTSYDKFINVKRKKNVLLKRKIAKSETKEQRNTLVQLNII